MHPFVESDFEYWNRWFQYRMFDRIEKKKRILKTRAKRGTSGAGTRGTDAHNILAASFSCPPTPRLHVSFLNTDFLHMTGMSLQAAPGLSRSKHQIKELYLLTSGWEMKSQRKKWLLGFTPCSSLIGPSKRWPSRIKRTMSPKPL